MAFGFDDAEHGAALFNLEVEGFRYSRISNPTNTILEARVAALDVVANMIVAMTRVEGHTGFFMNWEGQKQGEGYEYYLLGLAMTYALILRGAGTLSVDGLLTPSRQRKTS